MSKDAFHSVFNPYAREFAREVLASVARPVAKWGGMAAIFLSVSGDADAASNPAAAVDVEEGTPIEQEVRICPCPEENAWVEYRA